MYYIHIDLLYIVSIHNEKNFDQNKSRDWSQKTDYPLLSFKDIWFNLNPVTFVKRQIHE